MNIFSEKFTSTITKMALDTFGNWARLSLYTIIVASIGAIAGFGGAIARIDPRVSAVETESKDLSNDFDKAYNAVDARLKVLEAAKLETSVQVQMLILYQIPVSEREALRKEAEKKIEEKIPDLVNYPTP